jgi:hypothetical protein
MGALTYPPIHTCKARAMGSSPSLLTSSDQKQNFQNDLHSRELFISRQQDW